MNRSRWLRVLSIIFILFSIVIIVCVAGRFILPIIYMANSAELDVIRMNNPHIDSLYEGWHTEDIPSWGCILFPPEWSIHCGNENELLYVYDNEELIAVGTINRSANGVVFSRQPNELCSLMSAILGHSINEASFDYHGFFMNQCTFYQIVVKDGDLISYYPYLSIPNDNMDDLCLVFLSPPAINSDELHDIVEAIMYAFSS